MKIFKAIIVDDELMRGNAKSLLNKYSEFLVKEEAGNVEQALKPY